MNPLRRALLALGIAGVVLGVPITALNATSDHVNLPGLVAALAALVAWSFLGTGLVLWDRRPDNLTGPLMVALAFSWIAAGLAASNAPGLYIAGTLLSGLPFAILTHLLFAFPSGRLRTKWDRRFVLLGYLATTVGPAIGIFFFDPALSDGCPECPDNPLLIWNNQDAYDAGNAVTSVLAAVVLGALIWHLVSRWRDSEDPSERVREAPVWWAGGATLLLVLVLLATNLGPEEGNFDDYLFAAALLLLATLPYAFWLGVLRSRLWEAEVVAVENVRLDAELQERLDELRESRARIVEAGYAERRRVERDLHDGAQQRLVALALELQMVRSKLASDPAAASELLDAATRELTGATEELRELARGLHPPVLADRGLVAALEALAQRALAAGQRRDRRDPARVRGGRGRRVLRRLRGAHERGPPRPGGAGSRTSRAAQRPAVRGDRGRRQRRREPGRRLRAARPGRPRGRAGRVAGSREPRRPRDDRAGEPAVRG